MWLGRSLHVNEKTVRALSQKMESLMPVVDGSRRSTASARSRSPSGLSQLTIPPAAGFLPPPYRQFSLEQQQTQESAFQRAPLLRRRSSFACVNAVDADDETPRQALTRRRRIFKDSRSFSMNSNFALVPPKEEGEDLV